MPKHPCLGCTYFKACGETTRTAPCDGRKTKREIELDDDLPDAKTIHIENIGKKEIKGYGNESR